jgi:hypothetical protein
MISFKPLAIDAAGQQAHALLDDLGAVRTDHATTAVQLALTEAQWPGAKPILGRVLSAMVEGWKRKVEGEEASEATLDPPSHAP